MANDVVPLALVAIIAAVIPALFKLLSDNTKASIEQTKALQAIADATKNGNREAKIRNGHLGEQNVQITEMIANLAVNVQNIEEQHVKHQTIDKQDKG